MTYCSYNAKSKRQVTHILSKATAIFFQNFLHKTIQHPVVYVKEVNFG